MRKWICLLAVVVATVIVSSCDAGLPIATPPPREPVPALKPWPNTKAPDPQVTGNASQAPAGNDAGVSPLSAMATPISGQQNDTPGAGRGQISSGTPVGNGQLDGGEPAQQAGKSPAALLDAQPETVQGEPGNARWGAAIAAAPSHMTIIGDIVPVRVDAAGQPLTAAIALPVGDQPLDMLDLFGFNGQTWSFVPSVAGQSGIKPGHQVGAAYQALALMKSTRTETPVFASWKHPGALIASSNWPYLAEYTGGAVNIYSNGKVEGRLDRVTAGHVQELAYAGCAAEPESPEAATQPGLPVGAAAQQMAVETIVDRLVSAGFEGLNLDCQETTTRTIEFVNALAARLHANGLILALTLSLDNGLPADDTLDRWAVLGQQGDLIYLRMPADPRLYAASGRVEASISQVIRRIDRRKVMLLVDTRAYEATNHRAKLVSDAQALTTLASESEINIAASAAPGTKINITLNGPVNSLAWDESAAAHSYSHQHDGRSCTVWLAGSSSLERRITLSNRYQTRGLVFSGPIDEDGPVEQTLTSGYDPAAMVPPVSRPSIAWTVSDTSGNKVGGREGSATSLIWQASAQPGNYAVKAVLKFGDKALELDVAHVSVTGSTATVTSEPTPQGSPTASTPTPETPTPRGTVTPAPVQATARETTLLRAGPGLAFSQSGQIQAGQMVTLTGRTASGNWLRLPAGDAGQGWALALQLEVQADGNVWSLPEVDYEPPAIVPPTLDDFSLGGQTHVLARPNLMTGARMNWVKFQHKWTPGEGPDVVADRIHEAHANGLHVLLSITGKQLYPEAIEFASLITFLSQVASLAPDAIEVWNEANIDREWPAGEIDPAGYVQHLLAPAFQAIKASNPNVLVISGALAPTGVDDGVHVWADDRYLAGMAAAGAKNYLDCIGVHHNAGATSPYALSGHPGGDHYSWYFWPTLRLYHDAFAGQRPVCFTELGYLTSAGYGDLPAGFSWAAGTSLEEHARWLAEAADLARLSGQVSLMVVFNIDFTLWDDDPQAGYAILRPDGACPACTTLASVMPPG